MLAAQWGARFHEIKGYEVRDADGRRLGRAVGLLLNPEDGSVYLRVAARRGARGRVLPWELLCVDDAAAAIDVLCPPGLVESAPPVRDARQLTAAEHDALRLHFGLPLLGRRSWRERAAAPVAALGRGLRRAGAALIELPANLVWRLRGRDVSVRLRWRLELAGRRLDDLRWAVWDHLRPRRTPPPPLPRDAWRPPELPLGEPAERQEVDV